MRTFILVILYWCSISICVKTVYFMLDKYPRISTGETAMLKVIRDLIVAGWATYLVILY